MEEEEIKSRKEGGKRIVKARKKEGGKRKVRPAAKKMPTRTMKQLLSFFPSFAKEVREAAHSFSWT